MAPRLVANYLGLILLVFPNFFKYAGRVNNYLFKGDPMKFLLSTILALVALTISPRMFCADKENKEQSTQGASTTRQPLVSSTVEQPGTACAPAQNPTTLDRQIPKEQTQHPGASQARKTFQEQLEASLKQLKEAFPKERIPSLSQRKEQVAQLSFLSRCLDSSTLHSYSHENYLRAHVNADTLRVAVPTADAQRSKFGHAANELVRKFQERREKDLIKRMGDLVAWSNAYDVGLNEADLRSMRELTLEAFTTALTTLILLDEKSAGIKNKIAEIQTLDATRNSSSGQKNGEASIQPGQQQQQ